LFRAGGVETAPKRFAVDPMRIFAGTICKPLVQMKDRAMKR
jgi:hypothetical protein